MLRASLADRGDCFHLFPGQVRPTLAQDSSCKLPSHREDFGSGDGLLQARLDLVEKLFFAGIYGVLGLEQAAALLCAAFFQVFDSAVVVELQFEAGGQLCLAPGFFDFAVNVLELVFQAFFEVPGPALQLCHLRLEKLSVPFAEAGKHCFLLLGQLRFLTGAQGWGFRRERLPGFRCGQ